MSAPGSADGCKSTAGGGSSGCPLPADLFGTGCASRLKIVTPESSASPAPAPTAGELGRSAAGESSAALCSKLSVFGSSDRFPVILDADSAIPLAGMRRALFLSTAGETGLAGRASLAALATRLLCKLVHIAIETASTTTAVAAMIR